MKSFISNKNQDMVRNAMSIKQIEYKNAELVLCEFMATQDYDIEEDKIPKYEDFTLQELHDFITDKIDALDAYIDRY
jgi:hypothetical protein